MEEIFYRRDPIKDLLFAVVERAAFDLRSDTSHIRKEALRWVLSEDVECPSFLCCMNVLGATATTINKFRKEAMALIDAIDSKTLLNYKLVKGERTAWLRISPPSDLIQ